MDLGAVIENILKEREEGKFISVEDLKEKNKDVTNSGR